jgi:hypothetical protein
LDAATIATQRKATKPRGRLLAALPFVLVPLAGAAELVAAERQHRAVPTWDDWSRAADAAKATRRPGDAIIVAPRWAAPLGRMAVDGRALGTGKPLDDGIDVRTAARSDLAAYARVLELSIRGKDDEDVKGFHLASEQRFGKVALRVFDNPAPQRLVRDLVSEVDSAALVYRAAPNGTREPCRWEPSGMMRMGSLFNGPIPNAARWLCSPFDPGWSTVGPTVITDLRYEPRRCIWMHPHGEATTTIELPPRPIGKRVVGWVGLHVFQEREMKGARVLARVSVAGKPVAEVTHADGDGWKRFEGSSAAFAGQSQPVKLELWAEAGKAQFRTACMAVELRD